MIGVIATVIAVIALSVELLIQIELMWKVRNKGMDNTKKTGLIFSDLLLIAFIVLKLCKVINWKWIWVLSPIWIGFVMAAILIAVEIWLMTPKKRKKG